jgi:microcystin-dependent protein
VTIDRVGFGSASWTPTAAATALSAEIKKISAIGGSVVAPDTIHVTASDESSDVYTVKEIGLFLTDNTLLAVYSQASAIITKGAGTVALIAADLVITGIPAGSVTVGDVSFSYPQATETVKGVAEIATTAESQAGTDDTRMLTPKKLQDVTATTTRKGVVELATNAEAEAGTDDTRALTPANLSAIRTSVLSVIYPIGEILISRRSANPATWLGFGTWERYGAGRTIVSLDSTDAAFNSVDQTGGAKTHTLAVTEIPAHTHTFDYRSDSSSAGANIQAGSGASNIGTKTTSPTGGGAAHNNLQPYIVVMMWRRTA